MERERWTLLRQVVQEVASGFEGLRCRHSIATVVLVHLWSVAHDRPTDWACRRDNWRGTPAPPALPDQSTMSRRMRRSDFAQFMQRVGERLNDAGGDESPGLVRRIDAKPLIVPMHSRDRHARCGRGIGGIARGYKLHMIGSGKPMPDAFCITSLNVCEKKIARRLLKRPYAPGYLLGDAGYDANAVHDTSLHSGMQLLCPRNKPGTGLRSGYQSPGRLRSMQLLEGPVTLDPGFGPQLYKQRTAIERDFSTLCGFGGGLAALPPWVPRPWRVRRWVIAKLLINAARIVLLSRNRAA